MKIQVKRILSVVLVALMLISVTPLSKTLFNADTGITAEAASFILYKTTASLNMRKSANSSSTKVISVPSGKLVFSRGEKSGSYTKVWYDTTSTTSYSGWVLTSYLTKTTIITYKTTASLAMREKASSSSAKMRTIAKGDTVYYYGKKSGDYTFVLWKNSSGYFINGWVLTKYLSTSGSSGSSSSVTTSPAKVSGVKITETTVSTVTISWSKVSNITGYIIYKYTKANGKYTKLATVNASTTSKTITNLSSGTLYNFCVQAYSTKNGKTYYGSKSAIVAPKTTTGYGSKDSEFLGNFLGIFYGNYSNNPSTSEIYSALISDEGYRSIFDYYGWNSYIKGTFGRNDPKGWTKGVYFAYTKVSASKIDWILKNYFGITANHYTGESYYYYDGYYYIFDKGCDYEYFFHDIEYCSLDKSSGTYYFESYGYIFGEYCGYSEAKVKLLTVDGKKVWKVKSYFFEDNYDDDYDYDEDYDEYYDDYYDYD